MIARAAAMMLLMTAPATAATLHCMTTAALNWNPDPPVLIDAHEGARGRNGWFEFWIDTATGDWRGRNVGSRALFSAGGRYIILSDGKGYRADWVGTEAYGGFESLRIDLAGGEGHFLRIRRDGFAETGTCEPGIHPLAEPEDAGQ